MAVKLDNIDKVIKQMLKIGDKSGTQLITQARARMRAIMRSEIPIARNATPVKTGKLKDSVKVRSRSRRGRAQARVVWEIKEPKQDKKSDSKEKTDSKKTNKKKKLVNYSGVVNFKKGHSAEGFASNVWSERKPIIDDIAKDMVKQEFKIFFESNGIKVIDN